ncbi:MAG TPA: CocE/NonD family hydrolase [Gemmatimonadota bacterium]|nr:CocE/NonD family hydrolase [Gemmatimonadota bacterium]
MIRIGRPVRSPSSASLLLAFVLAIPAPWLGPAPAAAQQDIPVDSLPSETPARFQPVDSSFEYVRRDVMIPMRDGVKLHTVILIPKGAEDAPILLTRTPYDATALTSHDASPHLGPILQGYDNAADVIVRGGYIRVVQDIRGKYGSEGDYVMNRPMRGPLNPTDVDESTDTWDTIDWLVKNLPESNGRVGILGISYDGWTCLTALVHPHPALKVSVPMNPMVDGWRGDDWFHNGAFRQTMMPYILEQEASRTNDYAWWSGYHDDYELYLRAGAAAPLGRSRGMEQVGFWRKVLAHPAYDRWWQLQAMDSVLAKEPLKVPVMLVASLWDQEDIYGAPAVYRALEPKDTHNDSVYLVMGPWHHGGEIGDGSTLGALRFGTDTGKWFRLHVLAPFLAHYLKDGAPPDSVAPVTAYETGADRWERLRSWPSGCADGCEPAPTPLYLRAGGTVSWSAPAAGDSAFDAYVSDPEHPIPYRPRPVPARGGDAWRNWLVNDQRPASARPDVLTFESPVLTDSVRIAGRPLVHLLASTTGTDADWVVKLIDVYPPQVAAQPEMGGFQLAVSMDIFRGRYRESLSTPHPIQPDTALEYTFHLPTANHVFRPGHRIMVQVQSSWFPLYDRNPQTYVPSIFEAKPEDFRKATMRVWHAPGRASRIEMPVVQAGGG